MTARRVLSWMVVAAMSLMIVAEIALGSWQLVAKSVALPPVADSAAARQDVITAASDGAIAILTYSPSTIDQDITAAQKHLTGDFLSYYTDFSRRVVVPTATTKDVKTTAVVAGAAVEALSSDRATVLVLMNQTTTSVDKPAPTVAASSVKVSLTKVDGTWLINQFEPV